MQKNYFYTILFTIELVILVYAYCYGKDGLCVLNTLYTQQVVIQKKIEKTKKQIAKLCCQIEKWHTNDFYVERFAREQLQMARKGDIIYYRR